jgi:hypothetical protein
MRDYSFMFDTASDDPPDPRLQLARLRTKLRSIDEEIEHLREDQRFFRKLKFTDEYQQSILVELLEQRRVCADELHAAELHSPRPRSAGGVVPSRSRTRDEQPASAGVLTLLNRLSRALSH